MWLFTRQGFFSAVQKGCGQDELLVRSRQKADLIALGKKLGIKIQLQEGAGTDYRYRAVLKKADWVRYLSESALELDYPNFKNTFSKSDFTRHQAYLRCWETLFEWQESSRRGKTSSNRSGRIIR
jgi:hypothetical protein